MLEQLSLILKMEKGSREESEVAGFFAISYIRMMGYFRLGKC